MINVTAYCWATANVPSFFTGMDPGGSLSTPTMSTLAMLSPQPPVPMTVSSRACPVMQTACPSPTAACKCHLPGLSLAGALPPWERPGGPPHNLRSEHPMYLEGAVQEVL